MKLLELFAGTRSVSRAFERRAHETYSVEWDKQFEHIDLYDDINNLTAERVIELCHEPAPRGARTGTQGLKGWATRSRIPDELCNHIVEISEE